MPIDLLPDDEACSSNQSSLRAGTVNSQRFVYPISRGSVGVGVVVMAWNQTWFETTLEPYLRHSLGNDLA